MSGFASNTTSLLSSELLPELEGVGGTLRLRARTSHGLAAGAFLRRVEKILMTNGAMVAIALAAVVILGWIAISADFTDELRCLKEKRS